MPTATLPEGVVAFRRETVASIIVTHGYTNVNRIVSIKSNA